VVGDAIEQGCGHFGIPKNRHPLGKGQIRGDDQRGLLVKLADQVEQQRASGARERQIALERRLRSSVEDHGVGLYQLPGHIRASQRSRCVIAFPGIWTGRPSLSDLGGHR